MFKSVLTAWVLLDHITLVGYCNKVHNITQKTDQVGAYGLAWVEVTQKQSLPDMPLNKDLIDLYLLMLNSKKKVSIERALGKYLHYYLFP